MAIRLFIGPVQKRDGECYGFKTAQGGRAPSFGVLLYVTKREAKSQRENLLEARNAVRVSSDNLVHEIYDALMEQHDTA